MAYMLSMDHSTKFTAFLILRGLPKVKKKPYNCLLTSRILGTKRKLQMKEESLEKKMI